MYFFIPNGVFVLIHLLDITLKLLLALRKMDAYFCVLGWLSANNLQQLREFLGNWL